MKFAQLRPLEGLGLAEVNATVGFNVLGTQKSRDSPPRAKRLNVILTNFSWTFFDIVIRKFILIVVRQNHKVRIGVYSLGKTMYHF